MKAIKMRLQNIILLLALSSFTAISLAVLVEMPSAAILNEQLSGIGLPDAAKASLIDQLAGQTKEVMGVVVAVDNTGLPIAMQSPALYHALFQGYPQAFVELRAYGIV